jgi:hypothetical protein
MNKLGNILRITIWLSVTGLVLAIPIAFLAALLLPNEYLAQGIEGAVDCDGPLGVMLFAIPSYVMYGAGVIGFGIIAARKRNWFYGITALLCLIVIIIISPNVSKAYREHSSSQHQQTCGEGW